ncbi:Receptor-type tyrosine-protein phosphatase F, partial [Geodia barretti]
AAPSAPPQDIVAVNQTLFTITISWQPVDCAHMNGNIRGYKVKYWERGSGNETKLDGNTTGTSYTLTDLQSSTTYVIQVAAENDAGVGVFGNLNASTLLFEVSVASTTIGVTLGQVENDVLITWNRTSSQCVDNGESFKTHPLSNSTMYMIPALEEYTEYNITVCINDSTCAFSIVTTNQAAPSAAPEEIKLKEKSSTSITIMWSPVPCDHHNGNITGYVVMLKKLDNGVSRSLTTRGSTMEYMIPGLEPSTEYEIQVAAFTIAAGPFTNDSLLASTLADTREGGSDVGGVVAGVIVSVLFLIGATLCIIAAIWLMRRKKSTLKGLFSMGHFKVTHKRRTSPHSRDIQDISLDQLSTGESLAGGELSSEKDELKRRR